MPAFAIEEVATLIGMVAEAANPNSDADLEARRQALLASVGELIGADAWAWIAGPISDPMPPAASNMMLHEGWNSDLEREAAFRAIAGCPMEQILASLPLQEGAAKTGFTRLGKDLSAEAAPAGAAWPGAGVSGVVVSVYPLGNGSYSVVGYCRRQRREPFTDRDRSLLHLVFQHVGWLHTESPLELGSSQTATLSPREKEVLLLLLEGHARKEVAARLGLSTHTIADYLKVIYKKLGVSSRAELLAKFIQSN